MEELNSVEGGERLNKKKWKKKAIELPTIYCGDGGWVAGFGVVFVRQSPRWSNTNRIKSTGWFTESFLFFFSNPFSTRVRRRRRRRKGLHLFPQHPHLFRRVSRCCFTPTASSHRPVALFSSSAKIHPFFCSQFLNNSISSFSFFLCSYLQTTNGFIHLLLLLESTKKERKKKDKWYSRHISPFVAPDFPASITKVWEKT